MTDVVDPATRSRMMSGIRGKNTSPEFAVRKMLHSLGFRYRLHVGALPGRPDIVLPKYGAVVFVNGCFWHGHDCHLFRMPGSNVSFWRKKIRRNKANDELHVSQLRSLNWRVLSIWECALKGRTRRSSRYLEFAMTRWLKSHSRYREICGTSE